jgi:hypothetical protein
MLNDPTGMKEILRRQNSRTFLAKFLPASLLGVSVGICKGALVDESGMIRTLMGTHNKSEIVAVHGKLCTIQPRNSNQKVQQEAIRSHKTVEGSN